MTCSEFGGNSVFNSLLVHFMSKRQYTIFSSSNVIEVPRLKTKPRNYKEAEEDEGDGPEEALLRRGVQEARAEVLEPR